MNYTGAWVSLTAAEALSHNSLGHRQTNLSPHQEMDHEWGKVYVGTIPDRVISQSIYGTLSGDGSDVNHISSAFFTRGQCLAV